MNMIKFHSDYQSGEYVFPRNSIWDFTDKYETRFYDYCKRRCPEYGYIYKVEAEDQIFEIPSYVVVEIDKVLNKDYTREEWYRKITTDAMVTDGDYVTASIDALGMDKPVKPIADQADYDGRWRRVQKDIEKLYGKGSGFEESS